MRLAPGSGVAYSHASMALLHYHSREGRLTLTAAILGSGMAFLDMTAVNVALPTIGETLGADFAEFQWILNGYMLTLASFVLVAGALGDLVGRRRMFLTGVLLFALASLPCGLAPGPAVLIAARVVQGFGAAVLIPTSLAMLQTAFRAEDRGRAIGTWAAFSAIWPLAGLLLGGWLIEAISWRAIFLINPVLAAPILWVGWRHVPRTVPPHRRRPDVPGGLLAVVALAGLVFPLIEGPERGWARPVIGLSAVVGVLGAVAFVLVERRRADPMLPLRFFRERGFAVANVLTFLLYGVNGSVFFLFTLQLQRVLGYTALEAGAAVAPITVVMFFVSPRGGRWTDRAGPRWPIATGLMFVGAGVALFAGIGAEASYARSVLPGVLAVGFGIGLAVPAVTAAALGSLEDRHGGLAAGVNNAMARTAQLLGIPLLPLAAGLSGIDRVAGATFSAGFTRAMWIASGTVAFASVIALVALPAPARRSPAAESPGPHPERSSA